MGKYTGWGIRLPQAYIARAYFQQSFALHGSHDTLITDDQNQVTQYLPTKRITFSAGKFSLADFYDNNPYSHDARTQFMNWVLMDNGAWDYPANTRGYTYGAVIQLIEPMWYIELSDALEPYTANGPVWTQISPNLLELHWKQDLHLRQPEKQGG